MELLLIRHAIACERDAARWRNDDERPLSARGRARGRLAAAGLRRLVPRPGCVLTSPLLRTRETAAILTQSAGWPAASSCKPLAPGTAPEEFLAFLRRNATARIAAVGHEPGLSELLSVCLYGGAAHGAFGFKKMGAALVTFGGTVSAGRGRLVWFLPPRLLRAMR